MQKDFVDGSLGTKEAVSIVPDVVKEIDGVYDRIFVTLDTHAQNYMDTAEGRHLPVVHCIEDTQGWMLDKKVAEELQKHDNVTIVKKPTFGSYTLVDQLRELNEKETIEEITLIGLCTDICVVSNALLIKAAFYETPIRVIEKCCAGVTPESHKAAIETMKMCQIEIC